MGQWNQNIWGEAQAPAYKVWGVERGWWEFYCVGRDGDDPKWQKQALGADHLGWIRLPT